MTHVVIPAIRDGAGGHLPATVSIIYKVNGQDLLSTYRANIGG